MSRGRSCQPPAGDRRPEPRDRAPRPGAAALAGRPSPPAPTASSSRCTRTPSTRSATARSRCPRPLSASTPTACRARPLDRARIGAPDGAVSGRAPQTASTVAVIGVGLMGGSLGLAARAHAGVREVAGLQPQPRDPRRRRSTSAPSPGLRVDSRTPCRAADLVFVATPGATDPRARATGPARRRPRRRGHRHGVHEGHADGRPDADGAGALRRRSSALRRRDRRRGQRAPSLYDGATYFLTPGAHADADAFQTAARPPGEIGARPVAVDPIEHDRAHGADEPPAARPRQRADDPGRRACRAPATRFSRGPELSRHDPRRGSNRAGLDATSSSRTAHALLAALATFRARPRGGHGALDARDEDARRARSPGRRPPRAACCREQPGSAASSTASSSASPTGPGCSRRSWWRSATPTSTSRTWRCIT